MKSRSRPSKDCSALLTRIVAWTAHEYNITNHWRELFGSERGPHDISDARTMAMTVAMAAGIPTRTVARAFKRAWAAVDSARQTQMGACDRDPFYRDQFIGILLRSLDSKQPAPTLPNQ